MNAQEVENLKYQIAQVLDEKNAIDIKILKVGEMTIVADYFIICTGKSNQHVKALADNLIEKMEELGVTALRSDGIRDGKWAVVDYGSIMVHIFNDETRLFYCLEKLWTNEEGTNLETYKKDE
ncbi:MAG: ribosome silencing factor [Clostridiales bacterium]|nr:ribosome silencing factor [Clostridiales bacterium]